MCVCVSLYPSLSLSLSLSLSHTHTHAQSTISNPIITQILLLRMKLRSETFF